MQQVGEGYSEEMASEPYFIDFLREAPEPTGQEDEEEDTLDAPKIYEQVIQLDLENNWYTRNPTGPMISLSRPLH